MLKHTQWKIQKESTHKYSIMTKSTTSIKTARNISPAILHPKKQKENLSNQNHNPKYRKQCQNKQSASLRQQINTRLSLHMKTKRAPSLIDTQITSNNNNNNQCLSSLRKMLTEYSPQPFNAPSSIKNISKQQAFKIKKREKQRKQFQLRQSKMIEQKRQKQQQALACKLRQETIGCTFKPKLTIYKRK